LYGSWKNTSCIPLVYDELIVSVVFILQ